MNYTQATDFLFNQLASYQNQGAKAFNKSLDKTILLLKHLGSPHQKFKSVHVAGTNGKGSSCHMLAAILQTANYKTGLFTSPHLKNFTERIKIDGKEVDKTFVTDFVNHNINILEDLKPSFFEITTVMAFQYFALQKVDIAIIETGLGGRLDSTNVILPEVSLITSIGYDHQSILGDTIIEIANEKAGIIKPNRPVVIGLQKYETVYNVFEKKANQLNAKIIISKPYQYTYYLDLKGNYQQENLPGVINTLAILNEKGWSISDNQITDGLTNVQQKTGLKGRWQNLSTKPLIVCDTGHNIDGIKYLVEQIKETKYNSLFIVFGMVNDKDVDEILKLLPKNAYYVFTQSKNERAINADSLLALAQTYFLSGQVIKDVNKAIAYCKKKATQNDFIFIGGSNFVVAEIEDL